MAHPVPLPASRPQGSSRTSKQAAEPSQSPGVGRADRGRKSRPQDIPGADVAPDPPESAKEREFMAAMDEYKRRSGRMFPTWCEVLEVLRSLGYEKSPRAE